MIGQVGIRQIMRLSRLHPQIEYDQEGLQQEKEKIDRKALPQPNIRTIEVFFIYISRQSGYRKDAIALVREGDSRCNPVPLLANH